MVHLVGCGSRMYITFRSKKKKNIFEFNNKFMSEILIEFHFELQFWASKQ